MKLQVAIDRVSLAAAIDLATSLDGIADVIELGTSLVKDYGLIALQDIKATLQKSALLMDVKTIDEGVYEFEKGYEANADILTVMGASDLATLKAVYEVAQKAHKQVLIDLLNMDEADIEPLLIFEDAIFGLHHSHDSANAFDAAGSVKHFHEVFPSIQHIAVAGGIDLEQVQKLSADGIAEVAIVGGKIAGADDPVAAGKQFKGAL
ncbi:3-hexulose-6-phosphate synthase [Weissella muntiaci]|uniref:3-hexulose-6-phosphate synthase n=1 Tax=Weissella muntiaci TaxID=2508881 RepID=A0A6C2C934_9LACO|nr:orotidine 5'-phosphate decarboxylase / HUMPS family protein [Weissella muntiaci]TYC49675.1 3-hexulose-6-phosphate synthase [Weissella muntiaci]